MSKLFPIFPEQASTFASGVDALYLFLVAMSAVLSVGIAAALIVLAVKYRKREGYEADYDAHAPEWLEVVWIVIPLGICIVIFAWGAKVFFDIRRPPPQAMEIYATGKQWMWKFQHPEGQREVNELHVPVNQPIRVTMGSEDVIHSLYFPAFRVKQDVVPGRFSSLWFEATKTGEYHLFCAEYCGTSHSQMIGKVIVMESDEYETWLSGEPAGMSPVAAGERLFGELGCATCHAGDSGARGPSLQGAFGREVELVGGGTAIADESYLRESIVAPSNKIVKGYQPIMPTFQGMVSEEQLQQLVAYVKSLGTS